MERRAQDGEEDREEDGEVIVRFEANNNLQEFVNKSRAEQTV